MCSSSFQNLLFFETARDQHRKYNCRKKKSEYGWIDGWMNKTLTAYRYLQLMTTSNRRVGLEGALGCQVGGISFGHAANGTAKEIFIVLIIHNSSLFSQFVDFLKLAAAVNISHHGRRSIISAASGFTFLRDLR
jgi:hypothetical protein